MAINVNTNSISEFGDVLSQLSNKEGESIYRLKPNVGEGYLQQYKNDGKWDLYVGQFTFHVDIRFNRQPDFSRTDQFCLSFQTLKTDLNEDMSKYGNIRKASDGIIFFANGAALNSVWHRNTNCKLVNLFFDKSWLQELESSSLLPKLVLDSIKDNPEAMFHVELTSDMKHNLRQMLYLPSEVKGEFIKPYMYNKCIELIVQTASLVHYQLNLKSQNLSIHPEDLNIIEQVKINLINNYQEPPKVEDLANSTGMSKSKLQRLFKALLNTSIYQFIKDIRMEKAMELLMQGHSVTEVGYEIGYSSIPNFSSTFKEHFNIPPGQISQR